MIFPTFFETVDFVKISVSPRREQLFSGLERPKITPKLHWKSRWKKVVKKHRISIWFSIHFRGLDVPKWRQVVEKMQSKKVTKNSHQTWRMGTFCQGSDLKVGGLHPYRGEPPTGKKRRAAAAESARKLVRKTVQKSAQTIGCIKPWCVNHA